MGLRNNNLTLTRVGADGEFTEAVRSRAVLAVCAESDSATEAAELMVMLGLDPEVTRV